MCGELSDVHVDRLRRIAAVLPLIALEDELGEPEDNASLDALERALGRALPVEVRAAYRVVGGGTSLLGGCLNVEPFFEGDAAVATHTAELRDWEWRIPQEVVVFGGDGGGEVFGLWLPAGGARRHPVLRLDCGDADGPTMGIVAQDFPAFFVAEIASSVFPWAAEVGEHVQRALGLPAELAGDPEERLPAGALSPEAEMMTRDCVLRWASPDVPEVAYDIYESGRSTADVAFIADRP